MHKLAIRRLGKKFRIFIVYSPKGLKIPPGYIKHSQGNEIIPEEIAKSHCKELQEKHCLFAKVHSLILSIEQWSTIKTIKKFLREKLIAVAEAGLLPQILKQKEAALGKSSSDQVIEMEEENEEVLHLLTEGKSEENDEQSSVLPQIIQFENPISTENLPSILEKKESSHSIGFRFFYNGYEIKDKKQTFFDIITQHPNVNFYYHTKIARTIYPIRCPGCSTISNL